MRNLTSAEKLQILQMQNWGTYRQCDGAIIVRNLEEEKFEEIKSFTLDNIPEFDVLLLFGGYMRILKYAAEIMYKFDRKYGYYPEFATIGAFPNKGQAWKKTEAQRYEEGMLELGFPEDVIMKNHINAESTSTELNKTEFLRLVENSPTLSAKERLKVAMVTEAGYSLRAIQEFSFAFEQFEFVVFETPQPAMEERIFATESFDEGYFVDLTLANVYHAQRFWYLKRKPLPFEKMKVAPRMDELRHFFDLGYGFYFIYENMWDEIGYHCKMEQARSIVENRQIEITGRNSKGIVVGDGAEWSHPDYQEKLLKRFIEEVNENFLSRGILIS